MQRNRSLRRRRRRGQTIVEYLLIIGIVVIAAVGIISIFSDTVRNKIGGIVKVLDPDNSNVDADLQDNSEQIFQDLDGSE